MISSFSMCFQHGDEIQERKEELYDLISLTENFPHTDYLNRLLLRELSAQVVPRPADPKWYNIGTYTDCIFHLHRQCVN
jgi:hypothetical protein